MKNSNCRLLKVTLTLVLFILSSKSYSQENFKDSNLALIESIAFKSKYINIEEFMKNRDCKLDKKKIYSFGEFYHFNNAGGIQIVVEYTSKKKLNSISIFNLLPEVRALSEKNISESNFIETEEIIYSDVKGMRWRKKSYPLFFYFQKNENPTTSIKAYKI